MPEGNMFARLCNPTAARRFKLRGFSHGEKRGLSWGSSAGAGEEVEEGADPGGLLHLAGAALHQQRHNSSSDEEEDRLTDDEWPGHKDAVSRSATQCLDLLETCWSLERARLLRAADEDCVSETESEPGPEPISSAAVGESGMGQRASSTSSLHVKPPATSRVSLTWALLKRQPSQVQPVMVIQQRRRSRSNSGTRRSTRAQSQPSLIVEPEEQSTVSMGQTAQPQQHRSHHKHERSSTTCKRFGYDINDVDEFLSKASLQSPANIPVVLSSPSVLYQPGARRGRSGRGSWRQSELSLPLGMVVNAVFRSHTWLYVHTPHGEAGYVRYRSCLPLGILPPAVTPDSTAAWDTRTDTFPPPPPPFSGRARRGATSVCDVRHRRNNKTDNEKLRDTVSECGGHRSRHRHRHRAHRPEEAVDRLFLESQGTARAESECARYPSKNQSSLAHRTSIGTLLKDAEWSARRYRSAEESSSAANIDSVSVKDSVSQCGVKYHKQKYAETKSLPSSTPVLDKDKQYSKPYDKHEIDHQMKILANYHYANQNNKLPSYRTVAQQTDFIASEEDRVQDSVSEVGKRRERERAKSRGAVSECGVKPESRRQHSSTKTETLLLIRSDYNSRGRNTLSVSKGDVVVLVSGRLKDWFWIRRGDGCEGFIPSVVAGHGFL